MELVGKIPNSQKTFHLANCPKEVLFEHRQKK